jgi:hypothetical protein
MDKTEKKRIVKDHEKLPQEVLDQLMGKYPLGFTKHLIQIKNAKGETISVLPFETEEVYYLIRMTAKQAVDIFTDYEEDDDDEDLDDDISGDDVDSEEIGDMDEMDD